MKGGFFVRSGKFLAISSVYDIKQPFEKEGRTYSSFNKEILPALPSVMEALIVAGMLIFHTCKQEKRVMIPNKYCDYHFYLWAKEGAKQWRRSIVSYISWVFPNMRARPTLV